ncbi:hypothetical protein [Sphingomonas sp.]|jgi:hypothetical protein|uniref:hypothetical protein n=1 Tax=Sphingomonas sp. TaxID=28214 RepID=UPI002E2F78CE|nr:hypothetical protein [Sphingomonas sp.]HEX4695543.1 hypothetical protein [Sphingomonas sp.]
MTYLLLFLAGAFLCNGIPHLAAGLRGEPFPTPFAKPPGKGLSPPLVNFVWGSANLFGGFVLAVWRLATVHSIVGLALMALGWLAIGIYLAIHFGKVRAGRVG